ncbi:uncharacterized protein LOC128235642 [Mya arenaria]|uniref:uncharacterized protein LOC128235642 n=1 Tax=Mya arenaria TaxID=6604 RepID=UPI0022DEB70D|nr:uncharacterized protein LOC128235642 [Mya arenaria]
MPQYVCEQCGTTFLKVSQLRQHQRTENHWTKHSCDICGKWFTRKDNLDLHRKKHEQQNNVHCDECGQTFSRPFTLNRHKEKVHQQVGGRKRPAEDSHQQDEPVSKILRKNDDPRQYYAVTKIKEQHMSKFKTTASTYKVNFKDIEVTEDVLNAMKKLFASILMDLTKGSKSEDLVRLTVQSPSLDYPIVVPFIRVPQLTVDRFMAEIERVLQSNEDFVIDESLLFEVTMVEMPKGGAQKRCHFVNTDKFLQNKKCIIRIQNNDDLCRARAIVTAKARIEKHHKWESIRKGGKLQEKLAIQLHEQACVVPGKCGIEEIQKFQSVLTDYQINVVSGDHFNGIIYSGPETELKVYLYFHNEHYDIITSMPAFLSRNYFCTKCNKGYDHREDHKCNNVCYACRKVHNEPADMDWLHCDSCNRFFRGQACFDLHEKLTMKGNSTCKSIYRCGECGKTVNRRIDKAHKCGQTYCHTCKDFFPDLHQCYMMPEENDSEPMSIDEELIDEVENAKTFIFFDFECTQDDLVQCDMGYTPDVFGKCLHCVKSSCGSYEHKPNLCVAQKVCTLCMNTEESCESCGQRERVFRGEQTVFDFCQWLFSEENYNTTVLCHNFQGYDSYPIVQYLYKCGILPTIVPNGAKIMSLTVDSCKLKMIDSINFLPMALAKLPSMFGIEELKKGYFPHLFNRKEYQNVVMNHLPDIQYYNPDGMKPGDRETFLTWYNEHKNDTFDLQHDLLTYCRSDVDILRRCCLKFRENFMDVTGLDPFNKSITLPSACNLVFRTNFLQPETIALIPRHGYNPEQKQSVKAIQWIKYLSYVQGHKIQHARNGGEKTIGPYLVDGYYETDGGGKVVLEFHGDFWHGNPLKYSRSTMNPVNQMTMGELYDKTLEKKRYLESFGYLYRSIWESDFDQECKENPDMRSYIENLELVTPLEPRDAFYGGRTEAYTMYKKASQDEDIDYYDVTSLYPWVNKTGKIPVGHPEIITENFKELHDYEGLVKCKILPPRKLFHPILPSKTNGKLLFHLCKTCADTQQQMSCTHTDKERAFVGTWVIDEAKKAISLGYRVLKLYEVWHFDNISRYDPLTKTGGLFTEYVNTFLKIKQEASGWPDWCKTETDRRAYIDLYEQKEGIRLEYHKIKKNPGLRALAKLMLNAFWGKFGQRSNMQQVDIVDDPQTYFDKLTSDREEVTSVNFVSEEAVEMRWKYKEDFVETNSKTNVIIAAYTTSQARLKLYSYLENLGTRALYADTDSVVFSSKHGDLKPILGDYLGDLTNEVPNNRIRTFVTGGPKNYGYELQYPDKNGDRTHCKIRGITLNYKNLLNVNFNVLEQFVTKRPNASVSVVNAHKITRDRDNSQLLTVSEKKDYKLVFDKRVLRENYISYPYGY